MARFSRILPVPLEGPLRRLAQAFDPGHWARRRLTNPVPTVAPPEFRGITHAPSPCWSVGVASYPSCNDHLPMDQVRARRVTPVLRISAVVGTALACAALVSACSSTPTASPTVTVTAPPTATTALAPPVEPAPADPGGSGKITVPNGVGKNYQDAQDLWRGSGLSVGVAEDATGANRLPVLDSGWVVLSQTPAAGTKVAPDTVITATVKKYTDR